MEKRVVGRNDLSLRVEHGDPVVDAVDDGLEALALIAYLADQAGHRVGHRVELVRQPGNRVAAARRHPPFEVAGGDEARGRLEPLKPAQHGEADDQADGGHEHERQQPAAEDHPPQFSVHGGAQRAHVGVEDQDAVDRVRRVVTPLAGLAVADGDHGAQDRTVGRVDHARRSSLLTRKAMARLAGRRGQVQLARRADRPARETHDAESIEQEDVFDTRLASEAIDHPRDQGPVVLHHLVLQRRVDQLALAEGGGARRVEQFLEMMERVEIGRDAARDRDRGGDADGQAHGHAGETRRDAHCRGNPRASCQSRQASSNRVAVLPSCQVRSDNPSGPATLAAACPSVSPQNHPFPPGTPAANRTTAKGV